MFRKSDPEPATRETVTSRSAPAISTGVKAMIGPTIVIRGEVSGEEDLLVQGRVEGQIELPDNSVTVGKDGFIKADVHARTITIEGESEGDLVAEERIVILQSGNVRGNLSAPRVSLEDGARFRGSIDMDVGSASAQTPIRAIEADLEEAGEDPPAANAG